MKILQLHIEGFRSLKNVTWMPGDLNVVIGPNGSGKSNLLRAIDLIATAAAGGLGDRIVALGGIIPLSWDAKADNIYFGVTVDQASIDTKVLNVFKYDLDLKRLSAHFRVDRENLEMQSSNSPAPDNSRLLDRMRSEGALWDGGMPIFKFAEQGDEDHFQLRADETLLNRAAGLFPSSGAVRTFSGPVVVFKAFVGGWRIYESIDVTIDSKVRQPAIARYEQDLAHDGDNLASVLHTWYSGITEFKERIDNAMVAAFGNDYQELVFAPASDQRIQLGIRWKSLSRVHTAADMSDGMIRYLFLLAILGTTQPPPVIAVDEPETGLHPRMLPIIAEFAVAASQRTQVILTTHSPQMLDAFGVTGVVPTTTVARWENGETSLITLEAAEMEEWLREYTLGGLYNSGTLEAIA